VIVVDTNVICYRWMPSPHSNEADAAWRLDPEWIVPLLWRSEFRNVLAGALRHRFLAIEAALEIAEQAETQLSAHEFLVSSHAVLRLVASSRRSAYDCEFVALAQEQHVPLVTVDRQVIRQFPDVAMALEKFVRR